MTKSAPEKYTSFRFSAAPEKKRHVQQATVKHKINKIVLSYFIQEGYSASALSLSQKANLPLDGAEPRKSAEPEPAAETHADSAYVAEDHSASFAFRKPLSGIKGYASIEKRKQVKYLILRGDVSEAIRAVSMHYPTVLDSDNLLLFRLLRLNLIEMIRKHKFAASTSETAETERDFLDRVLSFVREKLVNKVTHSMDLLKELEVTMSLLCFDFDPSKPLSALTELPEELRELFNLSLRNDCYRSVNKVILDLDTKAASEPQYQGVSFGEVSLPMLESLPAAEKLPTQSFDLSSDPELPGIEKMISFASENTPKDVPEEEPASPGGVFRSQLEEICKLWIATESILAQKKYIPAKHYFDATSVL